MKKSILLLLCCMFSITMISQQNEDQTDTEKRLDSFTKQKRHELSLDVTAALSLPAFQPRYEYILGRYSGLGADMFIAFNSDDNNYKEIEKFSITPFYRQYFFSKEDYGAKGFYAEGFLKAYTYENEEFDFFDIDPTFTVREETFFEIAAGASIGWKWVSNSGFMVDLSFGIGRNLGLTSENEGSRNIVIPRGGLHFGWRF